MATHQTTTVVINSLLLTIFLPLAVNARCIDNEQPLIPLIPYDAKAVAAEQFRRERAMQEEQRLRAAEAARQQTINDKALMIAVNKGNIETATHLIYDNRANVNYTDATGWTPLTRACRNANVQMVILLLTAKANPNQKNKHKFAPLTIACQLEENAYTIAHLLLQVNANPNVLDRTRKTTPLQQAFFKNNKELVELLLNAGANAESVWKICDQNRTDGITQLLRKASQPAQ
jgi:ankyrin repeat protein